VTDRDGTIIAGGPRVVRISSNSNVTLNGIKAWRGADEFARARVDDDRKSFRRKASGGGPPLKSFLAPLPPAVANCVPTDPGDIPGSEHLLRLHFHFCTNSYTSALRCSQRGMDLRTRTRTSGSMSAMANSSDVDVGGQRATTVPHGSTMSECPYDRRPVKCSPAAWAGAIT
jgi:hypothetical protein